MCRLTHQVRRLLSLGLVLLLGACATINVPDTTPLKKAADGQPAYGQGYQLPYMLKDPKGAILTVLAFSGGGKRSSAFAFGALRGLRDIKVTEGGVTRTALDEVDYISAVSGGSFPAAYYGLYRDKAFDTFADAFLYRDIDAYIWGTFLLPWNWQWLITPYYGTNDHMAGVYDRLMFHGATFADLQRNDLPVISINATDIANGWSFPFQQAYFDMLCADMAPYPVARAVAASNGFPVVFTPITLTSRRPDCGSVYPPIVRSIVSVSPEEFSRRTVLARIARTYLDYQRTRYVHLMDGGIADNLALRALFNGLIAVNDRSALFRAIADHSRRVLVVSIDGEAATNPKLGQQRIVTGLGQILSAVTGTQIDAYNFETLLLADQITASIVERVKSARCLQAKTIDGHACEDVQGRFVHISLDDVPDASVRAQLQAIPTGLTIPRKDVDLLVQWGEKLVRENTDIRAMTEGLDASPGS